MTDDTGKLEAGRYEITGSPAGFSVLRGAETWQFFAFVFAAVVTLALALLDEIPDRLWPWWIAAKVAAFLLVAYLALVNVTVRGRLSIVLGIFKEPGDR